MHHRIHPSFLAVALLLAGVQAVPAQQLAASSGATLYRRFCASCHGAQGLGDGPVAPFFKLQPPDLTGIARRNGGLFPADRIARIIDGQTMVPPHGAREMPIWGLEIAAAEGDAPAAREHAAQAIQRLVDHLRTLQKP